MSPENDEPTVEWFNPCGPTFTAPTLSSTKPAPPPTEAELVAIAHSAYVRQANMDHQERLRLVVRAIRKALCR